MLCIAELGQGTAVPFAGRMFANLGAEVVKVELGPDGDWCRRRSPIIEVEGRSAGGAVSLPERREAERSLG